MSTIGSAQGLRYLFEDAAQGERERFVFFCSACSCILRASKGLSGPERVIEVLENRCPGCGSLLESTISGSSTRLSEGFSEISLSLPHVRSERRRSFFRSAQSLRGFRSGLPPLDALIEPLDKGGLVAFRGQYAGVLAELLSFRAQLPAASGGMDSTVVFVDGGNCSDLYLFSSFARRAGVDPRRALRRVSTSRAFTVYQLADLLTRVLPRAVDDFGSKLVVVSDPLSMFEDPSLSLNEGKRVVGAIAEGLRRAKRPDLLVLATLTMESPYDTQLTSLADVLLDVEQERQAVRATLLKHPTRRSSSVSFAHEEVFGLAGHQGVPRFGKNRPFVQDGAGR
ncbi:MAG: hypothetical protein OK449_02460 [Thaumarchaeota archaeon]|nr:hypothetical protein [Nitrososphaerota archaeon]